jgi:hypothetical protein
VVCGDLCDRGAHSREVIDRLIERGAVGVTGNHDLWLTSWAVGEGFDTMALAPMMAGDATLRSYGVEGRTAREVEAQAWRVPSAHRDWLKTLGIAMDLEVCGTAWWVVHAGVSPSIDLPLLAAADVVPRLVAHRPMSLLWSATDPETALSLDRPVIMGHVPQRLPRDLGHCLAIDTGCGTTPGGYLTAVVLPERRFVTTQGHPTQRSR